MKFNRVDIYKEGRERKRNNAGIVYMNTNWPRES